MLQHPVYRVAQGVFDLVQVRFSVCILESKVDSIARHRLIITRRMRVMPRRKPRW